MRARDPDALAATLQQWSAMARAMPPAFDFARVSQPLVTMEGVRIGTMMPGRGLMIHQSHRALGLTRPVPGVFERPLVERIAERADRLIGHSIRASARLARDHQVEIAAVLLASLALRKAGGDGRLVLPLLGAIGSYDNIIGGRRTTYRPDVMWQKTWPTTVAGQWSSLLRATGTPGAMAYTAIPGGAVGTRATAGSLSIFWDSPGASADRCLITFGVNAVTSTNMVLGIDVLLAAGLVLVDNTAKTVNTTALTRYTDGVGVCLTYEVTTALTATAGTWQTTYTNQAGTAAQVTPNDTLTNSCITSRLQPLSNAGANPSPAQFLAAADYGVRSVQTATGAGASGTTGVLALILYYPVVWMPGISANTYVERDSTAQVDGLTYLAKDAGSDIGALGVFLHANNTAGSTGGFMRSVVG